MKEGVVEEPQQQCQEEQKSEIQPTSTSSAITTNTKTKKSMKTQQQEQLSSKTKYQLFNPAHRQHLLKVFSGLRRFKLREWDDDDTANDGIVTDTINESSLITIQEEDEIAVDEGEEEYEEGEEEDNDDKDKDDGVRLLTCTTCSLVFNSSDEQRAHYRLDWHRYNLKRKVHGAVPVTETEFDEIIDGLSSISGSDTENDDKDDAKEAEPNSSITTNPEILQKLMNKITLDLPSTASSPPRRIKGDGIGKLKGSPKLAFENETGDIVLIYKGILSPELVASHTSNEEDNDDAGANNHQLVDLANYFYPSPLLPGGKNLSASVSASPRSPRWGVIMLSGGHFAGAIFKGGEELRRKTFHSYTVRAKQGGGQSARDAKSGAPKSAGASLRRYNEASFAQHIQDLLESWKDDLASCSCIFYRALSFNEKILFGGKNPALVKSSPKLKTIPFPTKRPTHSEVKRVLSFLSVVQVLKKEEFLEQYLIKPKEPPSSADSSPTKTKKSNNKKSAGATTLIDRARSRSPKPRQEPERPPSTTSPEEEDSDCFELIEHEIELNESLAEYGHDFGTSEGQDKKKKRSRPPKARAKAKGVESSFEGPIGIYKELLDALTTAESKSDSTTVAISLLEKLKEENAVNNELNKVVNEQNSTFLHLASANPTMTNVIWKLLELGADPALKDTTGKYPYNYADAKESRLVFRKFRAEFPDKYNYSKAQVPEPLTEEMEKQKAEKKAALNKLKREKEKLKKAAEHEKKKEIEEKDRFLHLSDREKRALAAERRILGQYSSKDGGKSTTIPILVRCFDCGIDITGKIPFEYNKNVFCTTKCLAAHRKKFPTPLTV